MRIEIGDKEFVFEQQNESILISEFSRGIKRWIKFPSQVIGWVSDTLRLYSSLTDLEHSKRFGFLVWKIRSGRNFWGWFLELSVSIRGSSFSIFIPGSSCVNPWKYFTDSFFLVAESILNPSHQVQPVSTSSEVFLPDVSVLVVAQERVLGSVEIDRVFKGVVDDSLASEGLSSYHQGQGFGCIVDPVSLPVTSSSSVSGVSKSVDALVKLHGACLSISVDLGPLLFNDGWKDATDLSPQPPFSSGSCSPSLAMASGADVPLISKECVMEVGHDGGVQGLECLVGAAENEILLENGVFNGSPSDFSECTLSVAAQDVLESGIYDSSVASFSVDVVNPLPCFQKPRKKNPRFIAVVTFADEGANCAIERDLAESNDSLVVSSRIPSLPMTKRMSLKNSSSCSSPWDKMPKGIKRRPITKYSEFKSLDVDKKWVVDALELDDEASQQDIFNRMYQFRKEGKIKIKKKVIRILEGIYNDNIPWAPSFKSA